MHTLPCKPLFKHNNEKIEGSKGTTVNKEIENIIIC